MEEEKNKIYQDEETIDIREFIYKYLVYWKWFVLSVIIALILGVLYLEITPKEYNSNASILLTKDSGGDAMLGLQDILSGGDNSQVADQIAIITSRRLMTQVVSKLDLNLQYFQRKGLVKQEVYKEEAHVFVKFMDEKSRFAVDSVNTFKIEVSSPNSFVGTNTLTQQTFQGTFGQPVKFPFGSLIFLRNPQAEQGDATTIQIFPVTTAALNYINSMTVENPNSKAAGESYLVSLNLQSALPKTANKLIDTLISVYNNDVINDKKQVGNTTINFINERLPMIANDLGIADTNMERYKSDNKIVDIPSQGQAMIQQSTDIDSQLKQYNIQLNLVDYMDNFIKSNTKSLIPSNIGLTDQSIAQNVAAYNQLVLDRNALLASSTEQNPMVKSLDERIAAVNKNLRTSLDNYKTTTRIALNNIQQQVGQIAGTMSQVPAKEKGFQDIVRKQQAVEALYLLLLQKREEAEISTASTPNMIKIVDSAYYSGKPVAPKKNIVLLAAFLAGLVVPFGVLYVKFLLDNKVHSRKDVEEVIRNIPIVGYIPRSKENLVDITNTHSSSAEAFRILRTNINFLLPESKNQPKCIFITSTISGEGKTHVSINMAFTQALAGKKVLIVEADIRKPKVRDYLGIEDGSCQGITDYLSGSVTHIPDRLLHIKNKNLGTSAKVDLFPSGKKAPNPSELLMNGKFSEIIDYGRQNYDYVIVDTAPMGIVTDTLLISKYADLLVYVVRANFLPKNLLEVPKNLKADGKLDAHKTTILINDVDVNETYGYGNHSSGGYYGYGYLEEKDKPWYKRIFSNHN